MKIGKKKLMIGAKMENDTKSEKKFPAFIKYFILLLIAAYIALSTVFAPFIDKMEKKRYHKNIMTVADYVFSHDFPTNRLIELSDFPKKSAAYKAFKKTSKKHISIQLYDEHTLLITTDVIFHYVKGIIITDRTKLPNGHLSAPGYGYDGDRINVKQTENDRIYTWSAGL